jgi:rubrerythrin
MSVLSLPTTSEQTLKNLLAAFNRESNVAARYAAFARKTDEEGFLKVGRLFRDLSCSEQIHASNHASIIHEMGGEPHVTVEPIEVKSTAENLQAAIEEELYEINILYPDFFLEAGAQESSNARRTFQYAMESEKDHSVLLTHALDHVRQSQTRWCDKIPSVLHSCPEVLCVCPECGFTITKTVLNYCPVCYHERG